MTRNLIAAGRDTDLIRLDVATLDAGESETFVRADAELFIVVQSGVVDVLVDGRPLGTAGGRSSVFEAPGHAVYAPPGALVALTAGDRPADLAICSAPLEAGARAPAARIVQPRDQRVADVGTGNWARSVRTILGPEHAAGRLLVGETINPAGNWSSYPPHKHDTHEPPREVQLEEVYYFKIEPADGFGVQIRYDDEHTDCFVVREGDTATIRSGYHPVVAAPGYRLYYLWVMAGRGREMAPYLDPRHAWVQTGR